MSKTLVMISYCLEPFLQSNAPHYKTCIKHHSGQVDDGVKLCLRVENPMVGERSVHVLDFAALVVPTAWNGIDVEAIVLDLDEIAVPTACQSPYICK